MPGPMLAPMSPKPEHEITRRLFQPCAEAEALTPAEQIRACPECGLFFHFCAHPDIICHQRSVVFIDGACTNTRRRLRRRGGSKRVPTVPPAVWLRCCDNKAESRTHWRHSGYRPGRELVEAREGATEAEGRAASREERAHHRDRLRVCHQSDDRDAAALERTCRECVPNRKLTYSSLLDSKTVSPLQTAEGRSTPTCSCRLTRGLRGCTMCWLLASCTFSAS
ncbi:hypothetical protein BKA80DRAFT_523 [Phyllosticta citrichinensis]